MYPGRSYWLSNWIVRLVVPNEFEIVMVAVLVKVAGKAPVIRPVTGSILNPVGKPVAE